MASTPPANAFVTKEQLSHEQPVYPLDLFFCGSCTHLQLSDVLDPAELFRNYVYVSGTSPSFVKHFEDYAGSCIRRFDLSENDLVLDIGSNDGTLLKFFKYNKTRVLGIDPAQKIADKASREGIETWPEFFDAELASRIRHKKGPASLVTANNVFAHADDLVGITEGVRSVLMQDGVFVFEVSYLGDVYEKTLFDTIYHEHLAYHSVSPLVTFFAENGMDLFAAEHIDTHGGSLRAMVQLAGGPHRADGSIDKFIAYEKKLHLNEPETWTGYAKKITKLRHELVDLLHAFKKDGKSIVGFGAPAKATTLMHHFSIGPNVVDFIADDSPLKQGLYSPGLHIPVLAGASIYENKPDYIIILAWNFAEAIMANHQRFIDDGGKFIVPLPNIKVF